MTLLEFYKKEFVKKNKEVNEFILEKEIINLEKERRFTPTKSIDVMYEDEMIFPIHNDLEMLGIKRYNK